MEFAADAAFGPCGGEWRKSFPYSIPIDTDKKDITEQGEIVYEKNSYR